MSIVVNKTRLPVTEWQTKSGAIVSIDDARQRLARSLKVQMNPIQDLHGYDNPWPAGGGKNLLNPDTLSSRDSYYTINSNGTITVTADDTTGWSNIPVMPLKAGTYVFSRKTVGGKCFIRTSDDNYATNKLQISSTTYGSFTLAQDGGIKLRLDAEAGSYPITQEYQIEVGSTATSWSPYSNICPISGYQSVVGYRTGKNLFGEYTANAGYINVHGNVSVQEQTAKEYYMDYLPVTAGTKYVVGYNNYESGESPWLAIGWYKADKTFLSRVTDTTNAFRVWTAPTNAAYARPSVATKNHGIDGCCFYEGGTAEFVPYTGTTYPVSFPDPPDTVYGGTLDFVSGVLHITHGVADLADLSWSGSANRSNSFTLQNVIEIPANNNEKPKIVAEQYMPLENSKSLSTYTNGLCITTNGVIVCFYNGTDRPKGKLVYSLATPLTYHLTPQQIQMLVRNNTIWSDADSVEVEYAAIHSH